MRTSEGAASRVSRPFCPKTSRGNFPDAEILTPQQGARPIRGEGVTRFTAPIQVFDSYDAYYTG